MTTKKTVLQWFKSEVLPNLRFKDTVAKCEAWNDYTDMLCKSGIITQKQYETWTNPF